MALTKEDLQAIAQIVKAETGPINQRLDTMQADIVTLQGEMRKLNQTVARIENDHGKKIDMLYDAHVDTMRNVATIKTLHDKVDDHDHRLFALELAVKK